MEDHDRGRSRPEYEAAALDDLDWLGLVPDLGSAGELRGGPLARTGRATAATLYAAALERLAARREDLCLRLLPAATSRRRAATRSTRRPGTPAAAATGGLPVGDGRGVRVVMEPGEERFTDALLGAMTQKPSEQCGDLLLRDRTGNWTYQFAVVVDDLRHEVDLVIRGEDLLPSTGRQLRLARMLGRERPPVFLHHPLIRTPGRRQAQQVERRYRGSGAAARRACRRRRGAGTGGVADGAAGRDAGAGGGGAGGAVQLVVR